MIFFRDSLLFATAVVLILKAVEVYSIVGGHTTLSGEAPFIVALHSSSNSAFICAGVLVKDSWVLSTAQCVENKTEADIKILFGSHRLLTNKKQFQISKILRHAEYEVFNNTNNLALLQLSEAVPITTRVSTIALNDEQISSSTPTVFYGWGSLSFGSTAYSNNLQTLYQRALSTIDCRLRISNLPAGNICAVAQQQQSACSKDEGGPLVRYDSGKLIGIFNYGSKCSGNLPDVFVDVYAYKSWIESTIA
ncbi:chymotrypsin-2-like [Anopheles nili]|uniref:chymotrypsin-2-like n=1 Tax=Anopheles nili TaxID=185578 RepID=UPI00237B772F|nr:chymotrypsin-2-like [Anopheles nili]